jgi:hypothetical protein
VTAEQGRIQARLEADARSSQQQDDAGAEASARQQINAEVAAALQSGQLQMTGVNAFVARRVEEVRAQMRAEQEAALRADFAGRTDTAKTQLEGEVGELVERRRGEEKAKLRARFDGIGAVFEALRDEVSAAGTQTDDTESAAQQAALAMRIRVALKIADGAAAEVRQVIPTHRDHMDRDRESDPTVPTIEALLAQVDETHAQLRERLQDPAVAADPKAVATAINDFISGWEAARTSCWG